MKQLLQQLDSGQLNVAEVPIPIAGDGHLVVATHASMISAGTERMLVQFGKASLLAKARSQPERVRQVLAKVRTDGLMPTLDAVRSKLSTPIPLGYCQAGVVVAVGPDCPGFSVGDRVVTNGPHAEVVRVPHLLAARIPDAVPFELAAFAPIAAIGLQGIRLAEPTLGETVVVYGLGLIGLLTVQLLRANGCRVIGIDRDAARLALAQAFGADVIDAGQDGIAEKVLHATAGIGADAVLLTLASSDDGPVRAAAAMSRKRGRIVLVGVTGLNLNRDDFYRKELRFSVSCSYGPGRYDPAYEAGGNDYPIGFVRWTAQRNFRAALELMADGKLQTAPLITHRIPFSEAERAYAVLGGRESSLGIVLDYEVSDVSSLVTASPGSVELKPAGAPAVWSVGVIGAGNFAVRTLLPALTTTKARMRVIASSGGMSASIAAKRFGFEQMAADASVVLADSSVTTVFVLTRHDSHADLACRALAAGKHVFVEKPLALTADELAAVASAAETSGRMVMVGFNRRFAPLTRELQRHLAGRRGPAAITMTVNAGVIPRDHWTQDERLGGGRIVGEACHFIDLARAIVGRPIAELAVMAAADIAGNAIDDIATITLRFEDGSLATIHYYANGHNRFPKERVDVFADGKTMVIDNWRHLQRFDGSTGLVWRRAQDKGHAALLAAFADAVRVDGPPPVPLAEVLEVSRWSIEAARLARAGSGAS